MKNFRVILLLIILLLISYVLPYGFSQNHSYSYQLLDHPDGSTYYGLNVTIQESLYDYYFQNTHRLDSDSDFAKFVTPYALKPIADSLLEVYIDDEDFANGVLMIVHQIPYEATAPIKYPVETIVENKGDCDLFSYIAASIIKACGMDVVLLYYESQAHMNIGVSLSHSPHDSRTQEYYITHDNTHYYVAECTGGNWQEGWRVGECPDDLKNAPVQVITLENCEQWAPGQVSSSYTTLASSTIFLAISPNFLIQGSVITISGQLSPNLQDRNITIYARASGSPWTVLNTVTTDNAGYFTYVWSSDTYGICYIRASWSGNNEYAGADSPIQTVTILSTFFFLLLVMTVAVAIVGMAIFLISRHSQPTIPEPQPPEIPASQTEKALL